VNDIVELNKEVCRDCDADRFDDLQPRISKRKAENLGTQEMLRLKDNCNNAYKGIDDGKLQNGPFYRFQKVPTRWIDFDATERKNQSLPLFGGEFTL
jgi:hypothetical protein